MYTKEISNIYFNRSVVLYNYNRPIIHFVSGWVVLVYKLPIPAPVCYFSAFVLYSCSMCSMMLICAMTTDRLIAVTKPLHAVRYCNDHKARIVSLIIIIIGSVYSVPHFFATRLIDNYRCTSYAVDTLVVKAYGFVTSLSNSILPFVALMTMNSLIIRATLSRKKTLLSLKQPNSPSSTSNVTDTSEDNLEVCTTVEQGVTPLSLHEVGHCRRKPQGTMSGGERWGRKSGLTDQERQLIAMLLCVSFVFLILTLPIYIRQMVYQFIDETTSPEAYARYIFFYFFTQGLYFTNSSVNFYLYCLAGSKFREDLKSILCQKCYD